MYGTARCNYLISIAKSKIGDYSNAHMYNNSANKLYKDIGNFHGMARSDMHKGNIFRLSGEYDKALRYYEISEAKFLDQNMESEQAILMMNKGDLFRIKGDLIRATELIESAKRIFSKLKMKKSEKEAKENIKNIHTDAYHEEIRDVIIFEAA
jgi:tetratricopeptide (TPR) repeat protein